MDKRELELLEMAYEKYMNSNKYSYNVKLEYPLEKFGGSPATRTSIVLRDLDALKALVSRGFVEIKETGQYLDFFKYRITPSGRDFIASSQTSNQFGAQVINIGSLTGPGIAGNQQYASINTGSNLAEIYDLVSRLPSNDQAQGSELFYELKKLEMEPVQTKKQKALSMLGKFSDLLAKHSSLSVAVMNIVGKMITGS